MVNDLNQLLFKEKICNQICSKPKCPENIYECTGDISHRCKNKELSCIENLNANQIKYIVEDIGNNVLLRACPGSGKTEVLGIKSAYEIGQWVDKWSGIAILTFANSAENEIRSRIKAYLNMNIQHPHFIGTFTSWIHGYIANPFSSKITNYAGDLECDKSLKIIDRDSNSDFLKVYSTKYQYKELGNIRANEYYEDFKTGKYIYTGKRNRDGKKILSDLLEEDAWRVEDLDNLKKRFWKNGFCVYEDVEHIVYLVLNQHMEIASYVSQRFPVILVDECQDLSYVQLKILEQIMKQGSKVHFIGDLNQSIYGFRKINPSDTDDFVLKNKFHIMELKQNYRSTQQIVDICGYIINSKIKIEGCAKKTTNHSMIALLYENNKEIEIVEKFNKIVLQANLDLNKSRVIVRNNSLKNKLLGIKATGLSNNRLEDFAKAIYLCKKNATINDFKDGYLLLCKVVQMIYFNESEHLNSSYFYSPCEFSLKEWKKIVCNLKEKFMECNELFNFALSWKEWKKILAKVLKDQSIEVPELKNSKIEIGKIRSGNSLETVEKVLFNKHKKVDCYIETIHGCKGMSLDAVLFMSSSKPSKEKSGAYWSQWFDIAQIDEKNRMAYVACSRAKHILALGIPNTSNFDEEDRIDLINLGFEIIKL